MTSLLQDGTSNLHDYQWFLPTMMGSSLNLSTSWKQHADLVSICVLAYSAFSKGP